MRAGNLDGGDCNHYLNQRTGVSYLLFPKGACLRNEKRARPVVWSHSGVIFTAHATQPYVLGRLFPSSKQFRLPPPPLIQSNPLLYEPPTVISISPGTSSQTQLLFAYFPSRNQAGICCLWKAGMELDTWSNPESWVCARGAGVVASTWLGQPREVRDFLPCLKNMYLVPKACSAVDYRFNRNSHSTSSSRASNPCRRVYAITSYTEYANNSAFHSTWHCRY